MSDIVVKKQIEEQIKATALQEQIILSTKASSALNTQIVFTEAPEVPVAVFVGTPGNRPGLPSPQNLRTPNPKGTLASYAPLFPALKSINQSLTEVMPLSFGNVWYAIYKLQEETNNAYQTTITSQMTANQKSNDNLLKMGQLNAALEPSIADNQAEQTKNEAASELKSGIIDTVLGVVTVGVSVVSLGAVISKAAAVVNAGEDTLKNVGNNANKLAPLNEKGGFNVNVEQGEMQDMDRNNIGQRAQGEPDFKLENPKVKAAPGEYSSKWGKLKTFAQTKPETFHTMLNGFNSAVTTAGSAAKAYTDAKIKGDTAALQKTMGEIKKDQGETAALKEYTNNQYSRTESQSSQMQRTQIDSVLTQLSNFARSFCDGLSSLWR